MSDISDLDSFNLSSFLDEAASPNVASESIFKIDLSLVDADPNQVRTAANDGFSEEDLNALADSIRESGLIQPIVVRKIENDRYMVVVGERRYRACKMAGLKEIPVIIRNYDFVDGETKRQVDQLVENYQRKDLDNFEIAASVKFLIDLGGYKPSELGRKLGMSSEKVSMYLRLADCPEYLVSLYKNGSLSKSLRFIYDLIDCYRQYTEITSKFISNVLEAKENFDSRDLKDLKEIIKNRDLDAVEMKEASSENAFVTSSNEEQTSESLDDNSSSSAVSDDDGCTVESDMPSQRSKPEESSTFASDYDSDSFSVEDNEEEDLETSLSDLDTHNEEDLETLSSDLDTHDEESYERESVLNDNEDSDADGAADLESSEDQETESAQDPLFEEKQPLGFKVEYNGEWYVLNFEDLTRVDCNMAVLKSENSDEEIEVNLVDLHLISYFTE